MHITAEYLTAIRQQAEQQRLRLLSEIQQAVGAIAMIDAMSARLKEPEPATAGGEITSPALPVL